MIILIGVLIFLALLIIFYLVGCLMFRENPFNLDDVWDKMFYGFVAVVLTVVGFGIIIMVGAAVTAIYLKT